MDQPADQSSGETVPTVPVVPPDTVRPTPRRRPSGEPPPLPRHLKTSGVYTRGIDVDDDSRYSRPAIVRQVVDWQIRRFTLAQARSEWGLNKP